MEVSIESKIEPKGKIEAIIFASPSPLSIERLKRISGMTKRDIERCLDDLDKEYENRAFVI
ncbi:SMC-Scp complex subunit ScpB, partial [candidate division WOR-3 bacterium]|nr:SMC-Scp complex subunit ScpB [candidate division WOR-3 bacterium]